MTVFGDYSPYYDLVNRDKNYDRETAYVESILRRNRSPLRSILDLGCGTALHASALAARGYEVMGMDRSERMLEIAEQRRVAMPVAEGDRLRLVWGDIRSRRLPRTFDAVISLFHVISYQTTQDDIRNAFDNVRAHLEAGGVFLFDCWYGPAVLTDRPEVRTRSFEDDEIQVTRISEPVMKPNENVVDVNFRINVRNRSTADQSTIEELHSMRYLFMPEIRFLLESSGLALEHAEEWITGRVPGFDTWNLSVVSRAF